MPSVHGLGLVGKKPSVGFQRGNMLSRDIAFINNKVVVLRMISKLILTNTMRTPKVTTDESHYLAAMSL